MHKNNYTDSFRQDNRRSNSKQTDDELRPRCEELGGETRFSFKSQKSGIVSNVPRQLYHWRDYKWYSITFSAAVHHYT
jgi:hypothetical protein